MNSRSFLLPLAVAACCQLPAEAADQSASTSATPPKQTAPSIRFLRPIKGERFSDFPIYVQVGVEGFHLVAPSRQPVKNPPAGTGYVCYSMDDYPVCGTNETQVMIGKFLGAHYVPVGWHTLKAELVDANGNSLNPPVVAETAAFSGHPAAVETDHVQGGSLQAEVNSQELYKMRLHLQELQAEMLRIKTGNTGFVPVPVTDGEHRGE